MSLDLKPSKLMDEIEAAQDMTRRAVATSRKLVRDFHGEYFLQGATPDEPVPENHAFEWISLMTPKVIYSNPTVETSSRYSGTDEKLIKGLGFAVNRWAEDVDLWKTLTRVWYDIAFGFGVTMTTLETVKGRPGYAGARVVRPITYRVPPWRFFIDPQCEDQAEARFQGHTMKRDKEDLLKDPAFNAEAVTEVAADADLGKLIDEDIGTGEKDKVKRNEIVMHEIWVPEDEGGGGETNDGYHGTIYTLGAARGVDNGVVGKPKWLRDPRPFYGPRWGPYKLWGVYTVPGYVLPLSPLAATEAQVREMNAHAARCAEDAKTFKSFIGFDPENRVAGLAAKNARHGDVVAIPGLGQGAVQEFNLGGAKEFPLKYAELSRARVERVSGLGEQQRGNIGAGETATAQNIVAQGSADRLALIQNGFADCTSTMLYTACWYLWSSEFVVMRLGKAAATELLPRPDDLPQENEAYRVAAEQGIEVDAAKEALKWEPEAVWYGGNPIEQFDDVQLQIQAYSMQRVDSAVLQARVRDTFNSLVAAAPVMIQTPQLGWKKALDQIGEVLNMKWLGDFLPAAPPQVQPQPGQQQQQPGLPTMGPIGTAPVTGAGNDTQIQAAQMGADARTA